MTRPTIVLLATATLIVSITVGIILEKTISQDGAPHPPRPLPELPPRSASPSLPPAPAPSPRPRFTPNIPPPLRQQLDTLRQSYLSGRPSMSQVRLHRLLDQLWENDPPLELFLHEVADQEAPLAYRLHFANRIRNTAAVASPDQRSYLADSLRGIVAFEDSSPEAAVALGMSLMTIDGGESSVRTVATLLDDSLDDRHAARAVSALCQSKHPAAQHTLWTLAQDFSSNPNQRPLTLSAALPPLARQNEIPVEPVLQRIASESTNYQLVVTALECSLVRPPSPTGVETILGSYQRAPEFAPPEASHLRAACRRMLIKLAPYLRDNEVLFSETTRKEIEKIQSEPSPTT